jgi:hypothetical protein
MVRAVFMVLVAIVLVADLAFVVEISRELFR